MVRIYSDGGHGHSHGIAAPADEGKDDGAKGDAKKKEKKKQQKKKKAKSSDDEGEGDDSAEDDKVGFGRHLARRIPLIADDIFL